MKYNYIILALATLALCSCMGEKVETIENEGQQITIRAYQEGADETRTTLIDGGTQVYWEPSDEIKLFFRGSGSRFLSQNTENARSADFTGSLNVVVGHNEDASGSNALWGLYPYRADATSDGVSVTTTLPAEQTGRAGTFAKNTHITLAQSNSFDLAFYNVCGGIRFSLIQSGVKEVMFQGQNDENIAGKVKLAFVDGVPAVQDVVEGEKTITLSAPYGQTLETGKWYYIVALPGTLSNGFKMTFNTDTQYATLKSSGSKTIKRGIFGSLTDADEDLIYKDKEGHEPNPDDIIQFADPAAKYACVAMFDTSGDGEVSIAEAEAATSFEGLFTDWKGLTSFDEMSYFKNVHSLDGVFDGCSKLVSVTVSENISDLGTNTFRKCTSLISVSLPSSVTSIGDYAFRECSNLSSIEIPETVVSIGDGAFYLCSSLTTVNFPSELASIGKEAFMHCKTLRSVIMPPSVTSIGEYAFSYCYSLEQLVVSAGVTVIPSYCFASDSALKSITIPSGITSIENCAFYGTEMWSIDIPPTVTSIGSYCFYNNSCVILHSTSPVSIQDDSFPRVDRIYVPSKMVDMYKSMTMWLGYASIIHPINEYLDSSQVIDRTKLVTEGAVDMGTSIKWASCNVGAINPEDYGNLYAWGEIGTKSSFSWDNYKWRKKNGSSSTITKYTVNDKKIVLEPEDDAAYMNWGAPWRMPTAAEWTELRESCIWVWYTYHGVDGKLVCSLETGNAIFLPVNGNGIDYGLYWSSSYSDVYSGSYDNNAWAFVFEKGGSEVFARYRMSGFLVRPVCD